MTRNIDDLHFIECTPDDLQANRWHDLITLNREAVNDVYADSPELLTSDEMQRVTGQDSLQDFRRRLSHPNGNQTGSGQLLQNPQLTLAYDGRELLSWTYSVDNTSGEQAAERMDAALPFKRWLKIGWMATRPEHQGQGLASDCAALAIARSQLLQPISAWAYPDIGAQKVLKKNGLQDRGLVDCNDDIPTRHFTSTANRQDMLRTALITKQRARMRRWLLT